MSAKSSDNLSIIQRIKRIQNLLLLDAQRKSIEYIGKFNQFHKGPMPPGGGDPRKFNQFHKGPMPPPYNPGKLGKMKD